MITKAEFLAAYRDACSMPLREPSIYVSPQTLADLQQFPEHENDTTAKDVDTDAGAENVPGERAPYRGDTC